MELSDFIDIHTHILPGLDDGPKGLSGSIALAARYTDVGIKKVFATPHFLPGTTWSASAEKVLDAIQMLQDSLLNAGSPLTIIPGMEIAIQKSMGKNLDKGRYLPLGNSCSYLLEPPFDTPSFDPLEPLNEFLKRQQKVILAHPERCEYFQRYPQILQKAHSQGIAIQVNLGSLFGWFGQPSQKMAKQLLTWGVIDYLASDAHSSNQRRPPNRQEWLTLQEAINPETLKKMTYTNPKKLL